MTRDRGVTMDPAGVADVLADCRTITLATIGPDGLPHLAAMWFAPDGPDLLMWTYASSQKTRNLERDPRASLLAEAGETYAALRGVCLDCAVELIRDPADVLQIGRSLQARNVEAPGGDATAAEVALRAQAAKRVGFRFRVVRTRSWDHRRMSVPTH